ncbi:hypothetical protein V494_04030 [Pseudogymnoascus sp. VKM F-4513 (FW-928)]|nr:hypothetical protein V494_04030 [Pseudogymnoascus sp. VKM F-4513 (FW-928)]
MSLDFDNALMSLNSDAFGRDYEPLLRLEQGNAELHVAITQRQDAARITFNNAGRAAEEIQKELDATEKDGENIRAAMEQSEQILRMLRDPAHLRRQLAQQQVIGELFGDRLGRIRVETVNRLREEAADLSEALREKGAEIERLEDEARRAKSETSLAGENLWGECGGWEQEERELRVAVAAEKKRADDAEARISTQSWVWDQEKRGLETELDRQKERADSASAAYDQLKDQLDASHMAAAVVNGAWERGARLAHRRFQLHVIAAGAAGAVAASRRDTLFVESDARAQEIPRERQSLAMRPLLPPSTPLNPRLPSPQSNHSAVSVEALAVLPRQDFQFLTAGSSRKPTTTPNGPEEVVAQINGLKEAWLGFFKPAKTTPLAWAQPGTKPSCVNRRARRYTLTHNGGHEGGEDPVSACRKCRFDKLPCIIAYKGAAFPVVLPLAAMFRKGKQPTEKGYWVLS